MTKFLPAANGASSRVPWPPDPFAYSDGRLCVGGLPLEEVVAATGTPAYVYDLDAVAAAYRRAAAAFEPIGGRVLYAVKANADLAVGHGVTVHVESADELEALEAVAARLERPASFAVRVNPDVEVDTHVNIQTGHDEAKFGVPVAVAHELLARAARGELAGLTPVGVHVHVGSQLPDPDGVAAGARVGLEVLEAGRAAGLELDWLDVGGGLPVDYGGGSAIGPELFAAALAPVVAGRDVRLAVEPGRALVARAGALVAKVLYRKHRSAGRMLVVDTICESTDVLATEADLPDLAPGELVAFLDTGAYGMTMASNYNGQPRPAEIVVADGVARVARRRETWEELLASETGTGAPVAAVQGPAGPLGW